MEFVVGSVLVVLMGIVLWLLNSLKDKYWEEDSHIE